MAAAGTAVHGNPLAAVAAAVGMAAGAGDELLLQANITPLASCTLYTCVKHANTCWQSTLCLSGSWEGVERAVFAALRRAVPAVALC